MNASEEVLLLTPGPTPVHHRAMAALQWPARMHMDPEVFAFNDRIVADLHELYGSGPGAFASLLSGTGSLAMEAGLMNLLEAGDKVLVAANGVFGERLAEMAARVGAEVRVARFASGSPIDPDVVRTACRSFTPKLLAVVHGETSCGVLNPVPELGEVAREAGALFAVDAVTTVGMLPFAMWEWGIDYAYTGSQKCLSAPPGVAPVVFSARAMAAIAARRSPVASWYCDAIGMRGYWEGDEARKYHHTVPVQLHWAFGEALRAALEEGVEARAARAVAVGRSLLATLPAAGFLPLVPERNRLPTVLTVSLPAGLDDQQIRGRLRHEYGISIAGGLGETAGRVWRLGLMGEGAHHHHYLRFMHALERVLGAAGLVDDFDSAAVRAA